jgi:hypothetical protein
VNNKKFKVKNKKLKVKNKKLKVKENLNVLTTISLCECSLFSSITKLRKSTVGMYNYDFCHWLLTELVLSFFSIEL